MPDFDGSDFMELGDSNLVPAHDGWYINKETGDRIAPNGDVYDKQGNIIFESTEEFDDGFNDDEYEFDRADYPK